MKHTKTEIKEESEEKMTKEEILDYFKDINLAYNDCTKHDTLERMLDELLETESNNSEQNNAIDGLLDLGASLA